MRSEEQIEGALVLLGMMAQEQREQVKREAMTAIAALAWVLEKPPQLRGYVERSDGANLKEGDDVYAQ